MKNNIFLLLVACLILLNCTPAFAEAGTNNLVHSKMVDETLLEKADYILKSVNKVLESEEKKGIEKEDIDYNNIISTYYDLDLFDNNMIDKNTMKLYTENQKFIYYLPVYCDDITVLATIKKGEKVTEDDRMNLPSDVIETLEEQEDEWIISVIEALPNKVDYKNTVETVLEKNNIKNSEVYFVGGICSHISLAAVICNDKPEDTRILVLEQYGAETGTLEETFDYQAIFEKDKLYTYDEIKAIVDEEKKAYENIPEDSIGGIGAPVQTSVDTTAPATDNSKIIISAISSVAVLAIVIAAICIVKKKKKEKYNNL